MKFLFANCSQLKYIPDISVWNLNNVLSIDGLFFKCSSLIKLPDISKWNTSNIISFNYLFSECSKLESLPDISKWNTNKIANLMYLFFNCSSLEFLPDISKWNIFNINEDNRNNYNDYIDNNWDSNITESESDDDDMNETYNKNYSILNSNYDNDLYIGKFCIEMEKIEPILDIKYESIKSIKYYKEKLIYIIEGLFAGCSSLKYLPDISKWNLENTENISNLFLGCSSLIELPDI